MIDDLMGLMLLLLPLLAITWAPRTWTAGELVTASNMNLNMRDHLNALRATQTTSATGDQDDFALDGPFVYLTSTSSRLRLTGFVTPGGNIDGARVILESLSNNIQIAREDTGSTSSNRFETVDGFDINIRSEGGVPRALFVYDSSISRWRVSALPGALIVPQIWNSVTSEEFLSHNVTSDQIGSLGWRSSLSGSATLTSSATITTTSTLHPGWIALNTGATSSSDATMSLNKWLYDDWHKAQFIVRPRDGITSVRIHIGIVDEANVTNDNEDHDGVFFSFNPASHANWRLITRNGGTSTTNNSGVAVNDGDWYVLELLKRVSGNMDFYINGIFEQTSATNLPDSSDAQAAKFGIVNLTTSTRTVDCDFFKVEGRLGQRFT